MASGSRTTTIARPRTAVEADRDGAGRDSTLFGDLTRPISADRRLVRHRGRRWLLSLGALAVVAALLAALFTFPVKNWLHQQDQIERKQAQLAVLTVANDQLTREVARLQTADGALEAARDELGLVVPGEERISVLQTDTGPLPLPAGWPFDVVQGIIAARAVATPPAIDATPPTAP
jgi:cell division protein FtsB